MFLDAAHSLANLSGLMKTFEFRCLVLTEFYKQGIKHFPDHHIWHKTLKLVIQLLFVFNGDIFAVFSIKYLVDTYSLGFICLR